MAGGIDKNQTLMIADIAAAGQNASTATVPAEGGLLRPCRRIQAGNLCGGARRKAFAEGWRTKMRLVVQFCDDLRKLLSLWDASLECVGLLNRVFFAGEVAIARRITFQGRLIYAICRIIGAGACLTRPGMAIRTGGRFGGTVSWTGRCQTLNDAQVTSQLKMKQARHIVWPVDSWWAIQDLNL